MFCVECGREVDTDDQLRGGLCVDCLLERNPPVVVPDVVDLVRCPTCGSTYGKGGWSSPGDAVEDEEEMVQNDAADAAEAAVQVIDGGLVRSMDVTVRREARSAYAVDVLAEMEVMGKVVTAQGQTRVRIRGELCPVCSRRAGQYFEAIIQFRGVPERPPTERELERARAHVSSEVQRMAATNRDVYMVKEEAMHGGLDFYISTQPAAAQITRGLAGLFSASTTTSSKLTGRREGRDVVRVTHAVRLPDLRRGDLVLLKGHAYRVLSASTKDATIEPAAGEGKRRHLARDERHQLVLMGDVDSPQEAVVVSHAGGELQVLDPVTMRTVDLAAPPGFDLEGRETVSVVRWEEQLYLVG